MTHVLAYAVHAPEDTPTPFHFERRALRPDDVAITIDYCGVCHSDLHQARNDWGGTVYPCVPGHEIVGRVSAVGSAVTRHAVGDHVAVGCMVDSCMTCGECHDGLEQYCANRSTLTYNGTDRHDGSNTLGGYSDRIVVRDHFVLRLPAGLDRARAAPLLCAGITTWSPLRRWNVGPGSKVAVAGLGGLGHMAVKLAVGLGAHVTVITTSPSKVDDALALGAHHILIATDKAAMKAAARSFDFILDTIPVAHEVGAYLALLTPRGTLCIVGAIDTVPGLHSGLLIRGQKALAGSAIGGIAETQELLDFCADKGILPDTEMIAMADIAHAWERMARADVKYRFVIDMATLTG